MNSHQLSFEMVRGGQVLKMILKFWVTAYYGGNGFIDETVLGLGLFMCFCTSD